ncbi:5-formyltetrahydrofolate cyclo-ligase [Jiella sp. MQZ9-1]|uniref:5-formyltetrahydrofolate cyclo-ligase n=1 Tax=Jiella flava TaxID=2816857 RepID=A0A939JYK1_9HYPH|nr:5-formyltetrahydrofolate cyclo-ligase [Jiella flava]MBO0664491.1 5-formyltetrahydrofolate cyclo-ligase [Jiella flava]MCD2473127.1 5-formyltetrahydrofolate cyclo-ligase [Jiella flava]
MSADMSRTKSKIRGEALARRDAMDVDERIEASLAAADHLLAHLTIAPAVVSGFLPIRSEIDIRPLMMGFADRRARLCVPAIVGSDLQFRELVRGAPLEPQGFGTSAPGADSAVLDPELMLIPLAAFDATGGRIGYGRGYYDRAITDLRTRGHQPLLVGVAFACQKVDHVPHEPHDVPLDLIVTEAGLNIP